MTGGGASPASKTTYNLRIPLNFTLPKIPIKERLVIPEPTALVMFETQHILVAPPGADHSGFADVQWADSVPKMLQAALLQSFETYDVAHSPLRPIDGLEVDSVKKLTVSMKTASIVPS